ncbi:hypothetical protein [Streptomonospora wellingtoniae]|uniref:SH3 domain-containing protein n=1 Tax=Streptomonospora wellingtoniae TaxID=3075544 RepID=A0ABU2KRJ0_9ACTN|nr:hypothetical protein [Streptomonospora sp. DSM 45055]MDT0301875.1 hypothetical protein [Streptomonospora sp. DSM 45055]
MTKKRLRAAAAAAVVGCAAVLWATTPAGAIGASAAPDQRAAAEAAAQQCEFRVLKVTKIELASGDIAYQYPGDLVVGENPRGEAPVWVWSYRHVERGWIYRTYDNMSIIGCS